MKSTTVCDDGMFECIQIVTEYSLRGSPKSIDAVAKIMSIAASAIVTILKAQQSLTDEQAVMATKQIIIQFIETSTTNITEYKGMN